MKIKLSSNKTMAAFLTIDNILRLNSTEVDCKDLYQYNVIHINNSSDWVVERHEMNIELKPLVTKNGLDSDYVVINSSFEFT